MRASPYRKVNSYSIFDSDDLINPEKLEVHMIAIADGEYDLVWSPMTLEFGHFQQVELV